ncbi:MAG: PRC-barrel domain-containing protein [Actinomycetota bacterium]|nr:PRC-barrel domain-containing protein [Actinomycetota bacterium]
MPLSIERVEDWLGRPLVGSDGEKIGKLEDLIFSSSGTPLFAAVSTGLFGRRTTLVPLHDASLTPDHVSVPYTRDQIKGAPQLDEPSEMSGDLEDASAGHYGLPARQRTDDGAYVSAGERARQGERAREAEAQAGELEERAGALGQQAQDAEQQAQSARARADSLAREHQEALAQAQQARRAQQELAT